MRGVPYTAGRVLNTNTYAQKAHTYIYAHIYHTHMVIVKGQTACASVHKYCSAAYAGHFNTTWLQVPRIDIS